MLVRMVMRLSGAVTQRLYGAIVASFPTVDILPVGLVLDSRFGNAIFVCIVDK